MRWLIPPLMLWMLLRPALTMEAASTACALFVRSVMPGLFPYMVLALMLVSRMPARCPSWLLIFLGWCGGSPTGARLMRLGAKQNRRESVRIAVSSATMSPMFLLGTLGGWLHSRLAGSMILVSVIIGGALAGALAGCFTQSSGAAPCASLPSPPSPLSFGEAVEAAARTMLLVCGTMMMLRVAAALATEGLPAMALPLTTLLEVTTGASAMAELPLPLPLRTALLAGATGFGGAAVIMQNRAVYPAGLLSLPVQLLWQALHGFVSFLLALGLMLLWRT